MSQVSGKVCVIILNWNGWVDTLECLDSMVKAKPRPESIVVVDNGSTDQSVERILGWAGKQFNHVAVLRSEEAGSGQASGSGPPFLLIRNSANLGFAGGNNPAISWALHQNTFDFLWLLNNDTTVRVDTPGALLQCAHQSKAGIIGSTVVYSDRPEVVQCAGGCFYNPLTTIFRSHLAGEPVGVALQKKDPLDLDYIFGASLLVRTEVFARCGLLNEDYFLFYEEIDLCRRAKEEGYSLHWCRESVVRHKGSQSVGRRVSATRKKIAFANYHENLSTLLFTRRFYPWLFPLTMLFRFFGKLAVIGARGDRFLIRPLLMAYLDFFIGRNRQDKF